MDKPSSIPDLEVEDEFTEDQCHAIFTGNLKNIKLNNPQRSYAAKSLKEQQTIGLKFPSSWQSIAKKVIKEREEQKIDSMEPQVDDILETPEGLFELENDLRKSTTTHSDPNHKWLRYTSLNLRQQLSVLNFDGDIIQVDHKMISPNLLQERFTMNLLKKHYFHISIMKTEAYFNIKRILEKEVTRPSCALLGSIGIGKSFGLALNVLELRKAGHLVLYINNAGLFDREYFIKEILYALLYAGIEKKTDIFFENLQRKFTFDSASSREKQWSVITQSLQEGKLKYRNMLEAVQETFEKPLLIIVDQAPFQTGLKTPFLADLLEDMLRESVSTSTLILCSSRHPPESYDQILSRKRTYGLSGMFTKHQTEEFLKKNLRKDWTDQETFEAIRTETQDFPYELSLFCRLSRENLELTLEGLLNCYRIRQKKDIELIHVTPKKQDQWINYLTLTYLHLPFQNQDFGAIDENLCRFDELPNSGAYELIFYHPRYKAVILSHYAARIKGELSKLFAPQKLQDLQSFLRLKPSSIGDIVEKYIAHLFTQKGDNLVDKALSFKYRLKSGILSPVTLKLIVEASIIFLPKGFSLGKEIKEFVEKYKSSPEKERKAVRGANSYPGIFYLPWSENFEISDGLFVSVQQKKVFVMQSTLSIRNHVHENKKSKKRKREEQKEQTEDKNKSKKSQGNKSKKSQGDKSKKSNKGKKDKKGQTQLKEQTDQASENINPNVQDQNEGEKGQTKLIKQNQNVESNMEDLSEGDVQDIVASKNQEADQDEENEEEENEEEEKAWEHSDVRFSQFVKGKKHPHQSALKSLVEEIKHMEGWSFQWIWIGSIDGKELSRQQIPKAIRDSLPDIHEDSWIVLFEDNDCLKDLYRCVEET